MVNDESAMQLYYAARASEYDRIYQKSERQGDLSSIRTWLPSRFSGASVLEVACGTGYWTQFIASTAARMVAIDTAPETLTIARTRMHRGKVDFREGDAYALPANLGPFDAGFAGFWFSHVPISRRREFVEGLCACLRPGARVVLIDNRYVAGSSTPIAEKDAEGNTYQLRWLADGSTHRVLKNFPTEGELRQCVAGLADGAASVCWQHYWAFECFRI